MKSSLLVFVDEGNDDNLGIENKLDEVCDPLEVGIRAGIPDIEPKSEIESSFVSGRSWTATVNIPVQRSTSFDFVWWVWSNQITKFIEHRFFLHRTRTETRTLRR